MFPLLWAWNFPNARRGVELYRLAANAGYPSGQLRLCECTYDGYGAEEDKLQGVQLYARAAEQDNIPPMYRLWIALFPGNQ